MNDIDIDAIQSSIEAETDDAPTTDEIRARLEELIVNYSVPADEAVRSTLGDFSADENADAVRGHFYSDSSDGGEDGDNGGSDHGLTKVVDIPDLHEEAVAEADDEDAGAWVDVRGEVVDVWDNSSDSIASVFLIADETDSLKVTVWQKSADNNPEWPDIEEGDRLRFDNVVTEEYNGKYSVKVNSTSDIEAFEDDDFEAEQDREVEGTYRMVKTNEVSGLIKRCPREDCTRVLKDGECPEHGQVDGEFDMRIKAVLDNGGSAVEAILNREQTAELTGIDLEAAQDIAMDALDTDAVIEQMETQLLGRSFHVEMTAMGERYLVDSIEPAGELDKDVNGALQAARSHL